MVPVLKAKWQSLKAAQPSGAASRARSVRGQGRGRGGGGQKGTRPPTATAAYGTKSRAEKPAIGTPAAS